VTANIRFAERRIELNSFASVQECNVTIRGLGNEVNTNGAAIVLSGNAGTRERSDLPFLTILNCNGPSICCQGWTAYPDYHRQVSDRSCNFVDNQRAVIFLGRGTVTVNECFFVDNLKLSNGGPLTPQKMFRFSNPRSTRRIILSKSCFDVEVSSLNGNLVISGDNSSGSFTTIVIVHHDQRNCLEIRTRSPRPTASVSSAFEFTELIRGSPGVSLGSDVFKSQSLLDDSSSCRLTIDLSKLEAFGQSDRHSNSLALISSVVLPAVTAFAEGSADWKPTEAISGSVTIKLTDLVDTVLIGWTVAFTASDEITKSEPARGSVEVKGTVFIRESASIGRTDLLDPFDLEIGGFFSVPRPDADATAGIGHPRVPFCGLFF
jgi:hypothetical protein